MMDRKFVIDGTDIRIANINSDLMMDSLPPGTYTVKYSDMGGFYLGVSKDELEVPANVYGNVESRANKCIYTYQTRTASTGILMTGDKGTGKSLLLSVIANKMINDLKLPVVTVKAAYSGSLFSTFIESLGECCIIFDEFAKMYDREEQSALLTLFDGFDKTKRMFILTENSEYDINQYMVNRPSRIFYHFRHAKLGEDTIIGYCEDKGVSQSITKDIIELSRRSRLFSFDMLQSIVEEHLRFNIAVDETLVDLNIDIRLDPDEMIRVIKVIDKEDGSEVKFNDPLMPKPSRGSYSYLYIVDDDADEDDESDCIYVHDKELVYTVNDKLLYESEHYQVFAEEVVPTRMDYRNVF